MKKLLLLLVAPCVMFSTLSAQITQKEADDIVQQRLDGETKPYAVYAKETVQTEGFTVITATGETLELAYPCWVYYVDYTGETNGKYLIVKENNGNLLEVKTKKDTGPDDLTEWREVTFETEYPIEIPFEVYSLEGTSCQWTNLDYDETVIIINSDEELENYVSCTEGSYPEVDFSQYTLLLASGKANSEIIKITVKALQQFSSNGYDLNIEILRNNIAIPEKWAVVLIVNKLNGENNVVLNITYEDSGYPIEIPFTEYSLEGTSCQWINLSYPINDGGLIIINSHEELENHIHCMEGSYPEVDFSEYTLLLMSGSASQGICNIYKNLRQLSPNKYELNIEILLTIHQIDEEWIVALIVEKLNEESQIELDVTYEEFSLSGTLCLWTNLNHPFYPELIRINSNGELEQYISCAEGSYPEIDFSRYTLLLVSGISGFNSVGNIEKAFQQYSENEYALDIELTLYTGSSIVECWHTAMITNKVDEGSTIELNVTNITSSCKLKNLAPGLIMINSNEELENHVECTDIGDYPEIDFSKHTLLMAVGGVVFGIDNINAQLIKTGENSYTFDVDILLNYTAYAPPWVIKTLVTKLPSETVISLNVYDHH